ncbi:hypothetical protein DL98DRAFT_606865 [Cadophora sp. DSE1049]|nr:hypothetical protein DL98DRAFT_606865 [Cadophora sp. DSE1049]
MDQYNNNNNMDMAMIHNAANQSLWSRDKAEEKEDAYRAALRNVGNYVAQGYSQKEAEDICEVEEAERQYRVSKLWVDHVVLIDGLPPSPEHDPEAWNRKTNFGRSIPSLYEFCNIVAEVLIGDKKASEFDACIKSHKRIEAIKKFIIDGTPIYVADMNIPQGKASAKQASLKHKEPETWDYKQLPEDPTADQYVILSNGMVQWCGVLYRQVKKNSKKWNAMANLYNDRPDEVKNQAPITPLEFIRPLWIQAHIEEITDKKGNKKIVHLGRDATYKRLQQGLSSEITKDIIELIADHCPICIPRREEAKAASKTAEPKRAKTRAIKRGAPRQDEEEEPVNHKPAKRQRRTSPGRQQTPKEHQSGCLSKTNRVAHNQHGQSTTQAIANQYMQRNSEQFIPSSCIRQDPQRVRPANEVDRSYGYYNHWHIAGQRWKCDAELIADTEPIEATLSNVVQVNEDNENRDEEASLAEKEKKQTEFLALLEEELRVELEMETSTEKVTESNVIQSTENSEPTEEAPRFQIIENLTLPIGGITQSQVKSSQPTQVEASQDIGQKVNKEDNQDPSQEMDEIDLTLIDFEGFLNAAIGVPMEDSEEFNDEAGQEITTTNDNSTSTQTSNEEQIDAPWTPSDDSHMDDATFLLIDDATLFNL